MTDFTDRENLQEVLWLGAAHGDPQFFMEMIETREFREIVAALLDRKVAGKLDAPRASDDPSTLQALFHDRMAITGGRHGVFILTRDAFLDELRAEADSGRTFDEVYDELVRSARRTPEHIRRLLEDDDAADSAEAGAAPAASSSMEERIADIGSKLAATGAGERVMKIASGRTAKMAGKAAKRAVKKRSEKYQKRAQLIGRVGKQAVDRIAEKRSETDGRQEEE